MIQLELTTEEEIYLKEEINKRLADLDHEIAHTDSTDFKDMLKRRREAVRKFLAKLPASTPMAGQSEQPRCANPGDSVPLKRA